MMMGLGFWLMLLVLSVPILLLVSLALLIVKPILLKTGLHRHAGTVGTASGAGGSTCSHCGARLDPAWLHCPQCGAPVDG